jgi:hypothetical protein
MEQTVSIPDSAVWSGRVHKTDERRELSVVESGRGGSLVWDVPGGFGAGGNR